MNRLCSEHLFNKDLLKPSIYKTKQCRDLNMPRHGTVFAKLAVIFQF